MNCTEVSVVLTNINVPATKSGTGINSFDIDLINNANSLPNCKELNKTMRKIRKNVKSSKTKKYNQETENNNKDTKSSYEHKLKDYVSHDLKKNSTQVSDASFKIIKFKEFYYVQNHDPGGCKTLHCYSDEVSHFGADKYEEFVNEFLDLALSEYTPGVPTYVLAVMHNGASHLPDLLEHVADTYPSLASKRMLMGCSVVESLTMKEYREKVHSTYSTGTYRCGPLLQLSMVGQASEESGAYLGDVLDQLEENYLIKVMMPWGKRSCLEKLPRCHSNDGPIMWCRCGEQMVPPMDVASSKTNPKKRGINELRRLQYLPRSSEVREVLVEDRTRCHADQVGGLLNKQATAAVGVLKAIHANKPHRDTRVVKEVMCVGGEHLEAIVDRLKLDLLEPPMTQCVTWLDEARMNQLNREGIQTAKVTLRDNDVYVIPRNVVHQFRTITATTSVAWHVRLKQYHVEGKCCCTEVVEGMGGSDREEYGEDGGGCGELQKSGDGHGDQSASTAKKKKRKLVKSSQKNFDEVVVKKD